MANFEYPRALRLLKPVEFKCVFDGANLKVFDPSLLILARTNTIGHPRLGFVISKKNARKAVHRSRIRRIIRESFRLRQHELPNVDCVVIARQGISELDRQALRALIEKSWNRLERKASHT